MKQCGRYQEEKGPMDLVCLDLEGVLIPEIWIAFAETTGIDALRATTRDIPNYDDLMRQRLGLLRQQPRPQARERVALLVEKERATQVEAGRRGL